MKQKERKKRPVFPAVSALFPLVCGSLTAFFLWQGKFGYAAAATAVASFLAFCFYAADKRAACNDRWRIRESTLHWWELCFGWPGAVAAQLLLHHKNRKGSYQLVFWCMAAVNVSLAVFCASSAVRSWLAAKLSGAF